MNNIVDFKAITKHAYYSGDDPEALYCDKTDKEVNTWQFAAQRMLERYSEAWFDDASPRNLIIAHDMGRDYRTRLFEGYKQSSVAEEDKSEVEAEQKKALEAWAKKFFAAIGATQIGVEGVEADDIIAWLCSGIKGPKQVFTVDADLLQLVDENTLVYLKMEPHYHGGDHKGIPYPLTSIAKSILGDTSDKYPGIKGIGPVKFQELLETYDEDGILELQTIVESGNPTELDAAIQATGDKTLIKMRAAFEDWRLMWKLAKLHPELCWKPRGRKLVKPTIHKRVANAEALNRLLVEAGADDFIEQFEPMMPRFIAVDANNWPDIRDDILAEIQQGDITAFDYETYDPDPNPNFLEASPGDGFVDMLSHRLTGAAFTFGKHLENTVYITVNHKDAANLPASVIAEVLEFAGQHTQLVVQNALFEGIISQTNLNLKLKNVHDTRIMQRYYNENAEAGLKAMSKAYLGYNQKSYRETVGDKGSMAELTLEEVFGYGVDDGIVTGVLYDLLKLLLQCDQQWDFYTRWAVCPTEVLQHSYINGVDVNWKLQKQVYEDDVKTLNDSQEKLRSLLEENVTGEVTSGCLSFIQEERDYVFKSNKRTLRDKKGLKADELMQATRDAVARWERKLKDACIYTSYREEEVMPAFALTPKNLSPAAEALGLEPITKVTNKALEEYLNQYGMIGIEDDDVPEDEQQVAFLEALCTAYETGGFKLSATQKKLEAAWESEDEVTADALEKEIEKARAAVDKLRKISQKSAGVEPKLIKSGDELSFGSPQQMQHLLYCKIGVPVRLRSKGTLSKSRMTLGFRENGPATDEDAIRTALANDVESGTWQHEALNLTLKAKSALTKISLYHKKYPLWLHHKDGKIHPSFTDAGTDTRRPTGSSPNMLQVSKKDKTMRTMFVPPSRDWVVVAIDYASQEIRLMACEANDPVMKSVYDPADEKDLHSMTGSGIAKMEYSAFIAAREDENHKLHPLVEAMRKKAKGVNFGLAYGAGGSTLSRNLIIKLEEAQKLLQDALNLYQRIKPWQAETAEFMDKHGYTLTAFGTKRHATDDLFNSDKGKRARQHRQGTNATIQGTAAEMLRIVLTKIAERELTERLKMVFFAPIYDEVVSFVHKDDVVEYCTEMRDIMESATPPGHDIPQVPEFSIGATWGTVHELGRWPGEEVIQRAVERALEESAEIWDNDMQEVA